MYLSWKGPPAHLRSKFPLGGVHPAVPLRVGRTLVCAPSASRHVPLVKRREKLPAKQRRRPINQDIPRPFKVSPWQARKRMHEHTRTSANASAHACCATHTFTAHICKHAKVPSFAPEFIPRLLIEVNNAKGPLQLASLVSEHGPSMPAQHVSSVLSRLAGFATDGGLDEAQVCG